LARSFGPSAFSEACTDARAVIAAAVSPPVGKPHPLGWVRDKIWSV